MASKFLAGKVCLVTGGAEGIGWAIVQALADYGGDVYVCTSSIENLTMAQNELQKMPWQEKIHLAQCDVARRADVEGWIAGIYGRTGRIDVLVNNAAFIRWESVDEMPVEEFERMMQVNYFAIVYAVKAVLPLMHAAGQGHIINISSSAGKLFVNRRTAGYAASKAASDAFTQTLSMELQGTPITATVVCLGAVAGTDFFRKHVPFTHMPRLGDYFAYLTPPQVADGIIRTLRSRKSTLDMPGYLPAMYVVFALMPNALRWLINWGGSGRRDYGAVKWRYTPK